MDKDVLEFEALEYFTHDKNGAIEKSGLKYLWKAHVKGYTVTNDDGSTTTFKLSRKWYKNHMSPEEWACRKKQIAVAILCLVVSCFVETAFAKHCKVTNPDWTDEQEQLANLLLTIAVGQMCLRATWHVTGAFDEEKQPKEVSGYDEGVQEAG